MRPALVIFDCDGVLVDSEPITTRMLAEDLTAHGLPISIAECNELFVGGTIAAVEERASAMGARLPADWVQRFYDRMVDTLSREVTIIPGIADVLDRLDGAEVPYCVASNGPMRKMEATLGSTGLWDRMAGRIYSAHDVGVAKPDPGLFLQAARSMDHPAPASVVIEDSVSGVRAAAAAGMRCLGYARDTPAEKLSQYGAETFEDMVDLPAMLSL
ncbi:MAG: HAD-IA family hydrolase [Pseudomonadota bacterium]